MNSLWSFRILSIFFLCVPGLASAAGQALWGYPCDVFMSAACLRLPNDMSISYEVPADFGIYTVSSSGQALLSIYVGTAPRLPDELGKASLKLSGADYKVRGFHSTIKGTERLDLVMSSNGKNAVTVHLFARFSEEKREAIAALVAGLRPCDRPSSEEFRCPENSSVGKAFSDWVLMQHSVDKVPSSP